MLVTEWALLTLNLTIEELLPIISDALDMGFEFKVENHNLYFREK